MPNIKTSHDRNTIRRISAQGSNKHVLDQLNICFASSEVSHLFVCTHTLLDAIAYNSKRICYTPSRDSQDSSVGAMSIQNLSLFFSLLLSSSLLTHCFPFYLPRIPLSSLHFESTPWAFGHRNSHTISTGFASFQNDLGVDAPNQNVSILAFHIYQAFRTVSSRYPHT